MAIRLGLTQVQAMTEPLRLDRALFAVSGPETGPFLQNLVTADMDALASVPAIYGGLLTPQGKLIADFILWRRGEAVLVDVAAKRADDLRRRLTLYRLRAKVEIGPIEAELGVFAGAHQSASLSAPDPRLPALGLRSIAPAEIAAPIEEPEPYKAARVAAGLPEPTHDAANEEVFALEALFEELNGVGFQKGCFVGQENVSRMKRRATTRRKFCRVAFDGAAPAYGGLITAGMAELGEVRSASGDRAISLLRLDRASEAVARGQVLMAGGREMTLDPPDWMIMPDHDAKTAAAPGTPGE
jgi:tRNA-modifying protein YgfZ